MQDEIDHRDEVERLLQHVDCDICVDDLENLNQRVRHVVTSLSVFVLT